MTVSEYRTVVVPDIFLPDGTVMPGQAGSDRLIQRLQCLRRIVWNDARKLTEDAATGNRLFTRDEQRRWDSLAAELAALDSRIRSLTP
jgi:hypothetical protein